MKTPRNPSLALLRCTILCVVTCWCCLAPAWTESPVKAAAMQVAARLAGSLDLETLGKLDEAEVLRLLTPEERALFATTYWCFDVNVPVLVSVMRDVEQKTPPYWLSEAGFAKTAMTVKNEEYTYEVWRKEFDAGRVALGINGFDKHRPHYFVAVGPKEPGAALSLTNFVPENQQLAEMKTGATIYHDWPELVLTEVPDALSGQFLLPTIRGRAREAHIIGAFRQTPFPATAQPDQILLTWSGDPKTTQSIQWRTDAAIASGAVQYRAAQATGDTPWLTVPASAELLQDEFVVNSPRAHRFTAQLAGLSPGTAYAYRVGNPDTGTFSEAAVFATEPEEAAPFAFQFLSDTHSSPAAGELLETVYKRHADTAFAIVSGDLVGTGQYRDDWDKLFTYCEPFTRERPLMPSIGNHDAIDGLGADLYLASFDLPRNGPAELAPERSYALHYGNALFLMMDVTEPIAVQAPWLEQQLARSKALWKFAVLHFPPYFPEDADPAIREEWVPLFDQYHVDFVLSGHVHNYMRSYPLRAGSPVDSPGNGTIYMLTISLNDGGPMPPKPGYAAVLKKPGVALAVVFRIEGNRLTLQAEDKDGTVYDSFRVEKP